VREVNPVTPADALFRLTFSTAPDPSVGNGSFAKFVLIVFQPTGGSAVSSPAVAALVTAIVWAIAGLENPWTAML
jgi:hypothetical protein